MNHAAAIKIGFIKLSGTEEDNCVIEALTESLPAQQQAAIARLKFRKHRVVRAAGWLLLKFQLLQAGCGTDALAAVQTSAFGKPYLPGPYSFSLSYSSNYAICALALVDKLGIDIEVISDIDIPGMRRFFNDTEWNIIVNSEDPRNCFFQFWTRKESVLKADGRGLSVDLGDVPVEENSCRIKDGAARYYFTSLPGIDHNVVATLCSDHPEVVPAVERIEISDLSSLKMRGQRIHN